MKFTLLISILLLILSFTSIFESTPLDDYVYAPDPHFNYTLISKQKIEGGTVYIYNFTSQKWYDGK
jgi:PhoPQ-activated pathogenicity-related protein